MESLKYMKMRHLFAQLRTDLASAVTHGNELKTMLPTRYYDRIEKLLKTFLDHYTEVDRIREEYEKELRR